MLQYIYPTLSHVVYSYAQAQEFALCPYVSSEADLFANVFGIKRANCN